MFVILESGGEQGDRESHDGFSSSMSSSKSSNPLMNGGGGGYLDVPYQSNTMPHSHSSHLLSYSHMHSLDSKALKPQERLHATLSAPQYSLSMLKASSPDSRGYRPTLQRYVCTDMSFIVAQL
jgi:hypothetical protein